jgi:hypothetical protein
LFYQNDVGFDLFVFVQLQRTMVLPALRDSCLLCVGTDGNCNFSAMRSLIGLKLGGDLWLVSQISVHVLVSRFDYFLYYKQTKEQINAKIAKITVLQNLHFFRRFKSD